MAFDPRSIDTAGMTETADVSLVPSLNTKVRVLSPAQQAYHSERYAMMQRAWSVAQQVMEANGESYMRRTAEHVSHSAAIGGLHNYGLR